MEKTKNSYPYYPGYKDKEGLRATELLMKQYYLHVRSVGYLSKKIIEHIERQKFKLEKLRTSPSPQ